MPYGSEWRARRRLFQQYFSDKNFSRVQERGLEFIRKGLLANFLSNPGNIHDHIRKCVSLPCLVLPAPTETLLPAVLVDFPHQ
jgi:hypothetical protein